MDQAGILAVIGMTAILGWGGASLAQSIRPTPVNQAPVCAPKVVFVPASAQPSEVTLDPIRQAPSCTDPDGDDLQVVEISTPINGAVATLENGLVHVSSIRAGGTTFFYKVTDTHGFSVRGVLTIISR